MESIPLIFLIILLAIPLLIVAAISQIFTAS